MHIEFSTALVVVAFISAIVLVTNRGGLALLYFTPFYVVTTSNLVLHELVHIHFFATGYLFAWMIAGPDPGPDRPTGEGNYGRPWSPAGPGPRTPRDVWRQSFKVAC